MYMIDEYGKVVSEDEVRKRQEIQRMQQGQVQRMPEPKVNFQAPPEPRQAQTQVMIPELPTEQPAAMPQQNMPSPRPSAPQQPEEPQGLLARLFGDGDNRSRLGAELMMMSAAPQFQKMGAAKLAGIEEEAQQRRATEVATAQRNKTIEYLVNNGRKDLAEAVMAGMPALDAIKALREKPARDKLEQDKFGNWVNPYTAEIVREAPNGGVPNLDHKEQLSALNVLRDDVNRDLATFSATNDAWSKIEYLYNNQSGTSDYALTVAFANILDPGSVVRGEEQEAIARSGALSEAMKIQLTNALAGTGTLPSKVRDDILAIARNQYMSQAEDARTKLGLYQTTATRFGLDPSLLYPGEIKDAAITPPSTPPQAIINAIDPENPTTVAEWWGTLSKEQRLAEMQKAGVQ